MYRFITLSALLAVAAAAPEADPQFLYPALVSPHAKTAGLVTHPNGAVVPTDTVSVQLARAGHLAHKALYGYYGYPYAHYLGKREAESKADPQLLLPAFVSPHAKTAGLVTHPNGAVVPTDTVSVQLARAGHLAHKGLYGYYGYPYAHYLGKREAESKADADPFLFYGYPYKPVITSVGAFTTYSNGAVTPTNTPAVQAATANHLAAKAADYAAHGYPYGFHHYLGKREAESDPYLYYSHYPFRTSVGGLTTYSNGAVVPTDPANQAATAAHLATKAAFPYGYHGYPYAYYG